MDGKARIKWIAAGLAYAALFLLMQALVAGLAALAYIGGELIAARGAIDMETVLSGFSDCIAARGLALTGAANLATLAVTAAVYRAKKPSAFCGITDQPKKNLWPLVPLGMLMNIAVGLIFTLLPPAWIESYQTAAATVAGGMDLASILAAAVVAPVCEEVVFRGFAYSCFKKAMPRAAAIALQGILFGVMHGQPLWIAYAVIVGAVLALMRDRYGSLLAPITMHIAFNAVSYLPLLYA